MGCLGSKTTIVSVDHALCVDWSAPSTVSDLRLMGNSPSCPMRGFLHQAALGGHDWHEVNADDTVEMLPKSRRALTIQEIAALARSSLHGISQVVKDHVTKPTAMAQGRVAHLIEWKGWCKPTDSPTALESDFNSYSDLTEGEQEARFAAGVAEQFAIAEAKLRAWSSVDGEDSNDESYDEDYPTNEASHVNQSTDTVPFPPFLRDLLHGQAMQPGGDSGSPDALCSSLCSLEDLPLLRAPGGLNGPPSSPATPADLAAKILGVLQGLQRADCAFRSLSRAARDDSPCVSCSESFLSPEDEDLACEDYDGVCPDLPPGYASHRRVSDVASSGVVSLDEEDEVEEEEEEEEDEEERKREQGN